MATSSSAPLLFDPLRRPPSPDGMRVGTSLALIVHLGLIAALAYGVAWRRHDVQTLSAELWAAVPQVAAPMAPELPPTPPTPPSPPTPPPKPTPAPPPPPPPPKAEAPSRDADIALEKARKKAQVERDAAEKLAAEKAADKKKAEDKKLADKKAQDEKDRREAEAKVAKEKEKEKAQKLAEKAADKKEADAKAKAEAAEKAQNERLATLRAENLLRLNKELGNNPAVGNGSATSTGTAAQSAAPSASYAGRIRAYVKPNITYTAVRDRSVKAEVEVRVAPDGSILSRRLIKSSGVAPWDDAVLQAIDKTGVLPRDTDGRIPPLLVISFDMADA